MIGVVLYDASISGLCILMYVVVDHVVFLVLSAMTVLIACLVVIVVCSCCLCCMCISWCCNVCLHLLFVCIDVAACVAIGFYVQVLCDLFVLL